MRPMLFFFMILLTLNTVSATVIFGDVYDLSLNKANNVIVKINTQPEQQYVAKNGTYAFNVPKGEYSIEAWSIKEDVVEMSAFENITVKDEGSYRLDIIMLPNFDDSLLDDDITIEQTTSNTWLLWVLLFGSIVLVTVLLFRIIGKKKKDERHEEAKREIPDLQKILDIIRKEGGRTTQKELRKQIPLSEAKISLMISELENDGKLKKIKKGRGNIIIIN